MPEVNSWREARFISAGGFQGFSPRSAGSTTLGLWWCWTSWQGMWGGTGRNEPWRDQGQCLFFQSTSLVSNLLQQGSASCFYHLMNLSRGWFIWEVSALRTQQWSESPSSECFCVGNQVFKLWVPVGLHSQTIAAEGDLDTGSSTGRPLAPVCNQNNFGCIQANLIR